MATTNLPFGAQIDAWVRESKARMTAVFHEATQRTVSLAQTAVAKGGNMPVDTGFLRYSIRASLSSMPAIDQDAQPFSIISRYPYDPAPIVLTIKQAQLGQTVYLGYTAAYAGFVEYGTWRTPPRGFVAKAAAQWQETVNQVVSNLKARSGSLAA